MKLFCRNKEICRRKLLLDHFDQLHDLSDWALPSQSQCCDICCINVPYLFHIRYTYNSIVYVYTHYKSNRIEHLIELFISNIICVIRNTFIRNGKVHLPSPKAELTHSWLNWTKRALLDVIWKYKYNEKHARYGFVTRLLLCMDSTGLWNVLVMCVISVCFDYCFHVLGHTREQISGGDTWKLRPLLVQVPPELILFAVPNKRLRTSQRCSMGLRSGLYAGKSSRFTLFWAIQSLMYFAEWQLALYCWKVYSLPNPRDRTLAGRAALKRVLCTKAARTLRSSPMPTLLILPHTMILPLQCFRVGQMQSSSPGRPTIVSAELKAWFITEDYIAPFGSTILQSAFQSPSLLLFH